ncbi:MAG: O-antigen polymerase [Microgenomates group bacterium]|nr:O-antigen polymerase [Microgenomates group bacterium]
MKKGNKKNNKITTIFFSFLKSEIFINWLVFTIIFTVYFCSSVGLINSGDTPQFFTTEALLKNKNLDISVFSRDPHFFVFPDIINYNNQILSMRGYMLSLFMIPFHLLSYSIKGLININNFPQEIRSANFPYELTIVSLYTVITAFGLMIIWKLIKEITNSKYISFFLIILLAFGTYCWKYSAYYTRHGLIVLFLSIVLYCFYYILLKNQLSYFLILLILCVLSFGLDLFFFITMIFTCFYIFVSKPKIYNFYLKNKRKLLIYFAICVLIMIIEISLNLFFYGSITAFQYNKLSIFTNLSRTQIIKILFSTPILPTFFIVLFGFGKIPQSAFDNYKFIPKNIAIYNSVDYAKMYNFFGVFFITPTLLVSFFIFLFTKNKSIKKYWPIINYSFIIFFVSILMNLKFFNFWGGNQYDIRYFYSYSISLVIPLAIFLNYVFKNKNIFYKYFIAIIFILSYIFSLIMGWLGVINMYKPALTGERRIWMDIYDLPRNLFKHSFKEYLDATFMNRENFWIPVIFSLIFLSIYLLYKKIKSFFQHKKQPATFFSINI